MLPPVSGPRPGPIAIAVHAIAAVVVTLFPLMATSDDGLFRALAWSIVIVGDALVLLSFFTMTSIRRHLHSNQTQQLAVSKRIVTDLKKEIAALERRLDTRNVKSAFEPFSYWEDRAARMGSAAVGDVSWKGDDWDKETEHDRQNVLPLLAERLPTPTDRILDFGCGVGRYTSHLAELAREGAVGVDATPSLLAIAEDEKTSPKATFVQARGSLPFPDGHFSAIWVAYVLIHVIGDEKARTAKELLRVLKPGGVLFLLEGVTIWRTRSPHCDFIDLDGYRKLFGMDFEVFRRTDLAPLSDEALAELMPRVEAKNEDLHLVMTARKPG